MVIVLWPSFRTVTLCSRPERQLGVLVLTALLRLHGHIRTPRVQSPGSTWYQLGIPQNLSLHTCRMGTVPSALSASVVRFSREAELLLPWSTLLVTLLLVSC